MLHLHFAEPLGLKEPHTVSSGSIHVINECSYNDTTTSTSHILLPLSWTDSDVGLTSWRKFLGASVYIHYGRSVNQNQEYFIVPVWKLVHTHTHTHAHVHIIIIII